MPDSLNDPIANLAKIAADLNAEVARLRAENQRLNGILDQCAHIIAGYRAKLARSRADMELIKAGFPDSQPNARMNSIQKTAERSLAATG